jgi:hypothetical protein
MRIIKEYCEGARVCIIRNASYGFTVQDALELIEIVKKDFPSVDLDDANIVKYGGNRYKYTLGIEFPISKSTPVPNDYLVVESLEMTL